MKASVSKIRFVSFQVVQGEAEVAGLGTTAGIGTPPGADVTSVALGTGITIEVLTMDQRRSLAQIRRTEAMGLAAMTKVAMALAEVATAAMDSPTMVPTRPRLLEPRTSRPHHLVPPKEAHRTA